MGNNEFQVRLTLSHWATLKAALISRLHWLTNKTKLTTYAGLYHGGKYARLIQEIRHQKDQNTP